MIKIYSSPAGRFTINIKKNGKPFALSFDNYDSEAKRRWIKVSDPDIIKQLDESKDLNVYFTCDGVIEDENPPVVVKLEDIQELPVIEPKVAARIEKKDLLEGKRWLNSIGVPYNKMKNKETVINLAYEQGYELSFESDNK